jgi:hypothetical protein
MRELYGSYLGALWELSGSSMGVIWELSRSSFSCTAVDADDIPLLGHYHAASEQYILNLFFTSLMMPK